MRLFWLLTWLFLLAGDAIAQTPLTTLGVGVGNVPAAAGTTTFDPANTDSHLTLSNGNLTGTVTTNSANYVGSRTIASHSTGKFYAEIVQLVSTAAAADVGIANGSFSLATYAGADGNAVGYFGSAQVYLGGSQIATLDGYASSDVVSMAVDLGASKLWYRTNGGNWNNDVIANQNPATGTGGINIAALTCPCFAIVTSNSISGSNDFTGNFGATSYTYTVPSGFGNW